MGRRKHQSIKDDKFKFYLKDGLSAGGRFIMVANSLLLSKRFQALSPLAQKVYLCLAMEAGGQDVVTLSHAGAKKYGITKSGYDSAIRQLIDGGFIRFDDNLSRLESNRFRFIPDWQQRAPPEKGKSKSMPEKQASSK